MNAMTTNPVASYRAQNGIALQAGGFHPDPQLLDWIVQASHATGADPVALLATSLQESGGKLHGPAGDHGTSFSAFQFHQGGALANHPPSWAATYPAVLNRAQEFVRLGVHGGPGAAKVQGPLDASLYARGVNSLLPVARELLGRGAAVPAGAAPLAPGALSPKLPQPTQTPIQRIAGSDPLAQVRFIDTILNPRSSADDLLSLVQQAQGNSPSPGGSAVSPPGGGAPHAAKPTLTPGGGWGGSKALAQALAQIGIGMGLKVTSEKRNRQMTASGNVSDHWTGNKNAYAYDLSNGSAPTPQMDKAANAIAAALGVPDWHSGVLNVDKNGYHYQVLYRTNTGGNHFNHVHVGVHRA